MTIKINLDNTENDPPIGEEKLDQNSEVEYDVYDAASTEVAASSAGCTGGTEGPSSC